MKKLAILLSLTIVMSCQQNIVELKEDQSTAQAIANVDVLLFGTFHFANFNPENNGDTVQINVLDVLTDENQLELEQISKAIVDFNPDKIFVEYRHNKQSVLDSVYTSFDSKNYKEVTRNEIFQVGFRVAKLLKHSKVYGMDYRTNFPYDSLLNQMKKAKQFSLIAKDSLELEHIEKTENDLFASNKTLLEILFYYNDDKNRVSDINWYLSVANQGGEKDNFVGAYLASEWYRRNLYMYSLIQKLIETKDDKIMIIAGNSHLAMFKDFIDKNPEWKTTELKDIIKH